MLSLFLDASGHKNYRAPHGDGDTDYYVLGGVLVNDEQRKLIEGGLDDAVGRFFTDRDPRAVELHTSPLMAGEGAWGELEGVRRRDFLNAVRDLLLEVKPILIAQVVHKQNYRDNFVHVKPEPPAENALRYVLGRADFEVREKKTKCRLTLDSDSKEMRNAYSALLASIRTHGDKIAGLRYRPTNVTRLSEFYDPFYVDSHASRCLQLADYVSHVAWRAAERSQAKRVRELDPLWRRFYGGRRREPYLAFCPKEVEGAFFSVRD